MNAFIVAGAKKQCYIHHFFIKAMNTITWIHISCYHWRKEFRIVFQCNFLLTHLSCWELQSNFPLRLKKNTGRKLHQHQHRAELNRFSKPTEVTRTQVHKIKYKYISNTCLSLQFLNSMSLPFQRSIDPV